MPCGSKYVCVFRSFVCVYKPVASDTATACCNLKFANMIDDSLLYFSLETLNAPMLVSSFCVGCLTTSPIPSALACFSCQMEGYHNAFIIIYYEY